MSGLLSIVRDKAGNAIPAATVSVYEDGTSTLATIFEDAALSVPKVNPFVTDANGVFSFYAAAGVYDLVYTKQGFPDSQLLGVQFPFSAAGEIDHGGLLGLGDDDHPQYLLIDGTRAMSGSLDMGTNSVQNVIDPTAPQEAATKAYVDDHYDFRAVMSADETVAGTFILGAQLTLDTFEVNNGGHSFNTGRVVLGADGLWVFTLRLVFEANATGIRRTQVGDLASTFTFNHDSPANTANIPGPSLSPTATCLTTGPVDLSAGAEIVASAGQSSGGNLDVLASGTALYGYRIADS